MHCAAPQACRMQLPPPVNIESQMFMPGSSRSCLAGAGRAPFAFGMLVRSSQCPCTGQEVLRLAATPRLGTASLRCVVVVAASTASNGNGKGARGSFKSHDATAGFQHGLLLAPRSLSRSLRSARRSNGLRLTPPSQLPARNGPIASLSAGSLPSAAGAAMTAATKLQTLAAAGGGYFAALAGQYAPYAPVLAAPLVSAWQCLGARMQTIAVTPLGNSRFSF